MAINQNSGLYAYPHQGLKGVNFKKKIRPNNNFLVEMAGDRIIWKITQEPF